MYGKLFVSIYDGTLVEDWRALITFQQMIILCDSDGILDMTPHALQKRTGIPIEHIKAGIEILENRDPYSRTTKEEGRRITRLSEDRPWGWVIVNHKHYRDLRTAEERRKYMRNYMREKRNKDKLTETNKSLPKLHVSKLANTDADTYTDTVKQAKPVVQYPDELNKKAWLEYIAYRKGAKLRKLQPRSEVKQIEKIIGFGDKSIQQRCIDETISNGWQGVFPPKSSTGKNSGERFMSTLRDLGDN